MNRTRCFHYPAKVSYHSVEKQHFLPFPCTNGDDETLISISLDMQEDDGKQRNKACQMKAGPRLMPLVLDIRKHYGQARYHDTTGR